MDAVATEDHSSDHRQRTRKIWLVLGIVLFIGILVGVSIYSFFWKTPKRASSVERDPVTFFANQPDECAAAPGKPGDRRARKDVLVVGNFNAEWLFVYGGKGQDMRCPGACKWTSDEQAFKHLQDVADLISQLDADILHLSEVEGCQVLSLLLTLLPPGHGYVPYLVKGSDTKLGQQVALLTRIDPISDLQHIKSKAKFPVSGSVCPIKTEEGFIGVPKSYTTLFSIKNSAGKETKLSFTGVHFIAGPFDEGRCPQREGQAKVIKKHLQTVVVDGSAKVVIVGDMNDYDAFTPNCSPSVKPISGTLSILRSIKRGLTNALFKVPAKQRYTHEYIKGKDGKAKRTILDHVLVDPYFNVTKVTIGHHLMGKHRNDRVSDHRPVVVEIDLS